MPLSSAPLTGGLWVLLVVVALVCLAVGFLVRRFIAEKKIRNAEERGEEILKGARREAEAIKKEAQVEAKDKLYEMRKEFERDSRERREELLLLEKRLLQKEGHMDKKADLLEKKEALLAAKDRDVGDREKKVKKRKEELDAIIEEQKRKLQDISGLTIPEAKKLLMAALEDEVKREAALRLKRIEDETRELADKKAKWIISESIQRCAADHTVESTVSVVNLPNEEMKGRIIGREGRNIRALENVSGIDIIVDDTPEAVILSGFDPVRREMARLTLERLVTDGRIHPARIEEVYAKVKEEIETTIKEAGEQAALDADVHGLHPEEIKLMGRLKYRTSYGQNVLQHSKEVAYLAGVMAAELGVNITEAKRAGFLHDLGKALDHEVEGAHAKIGADIARKFNENPVILGAIAAHHGEAPHESIISVLVMSADAVSASRPGARRETLETYVKRLEKLEHIADSFVGVEKTYAIQAGREIRVIVEPERLSDAEALQLARDVSKKVEQELQYPGQIKVTVIRETRAVEYAR